MGVELAPRVAIGRWASFFPQGSSGACAPPCGLGRRLVSPTILADVLVLLSGVHSMRTWTWTMRVRVCACGTQRGLTERGVRCVDSDRCVCVCACVCAAAACESDAGRRRVWSGGCVVMPRGM